MSFWNELPKPFTVLAPLDGITDTAFRQMISEIGKPSVLFTEFTSCDGFNSDGNEWVRENLLFDPKEQPVVAQLWGSDPQSFYATAEYVRDEGFSGIDINLGCPDRAVIKAGAGSALIRDHAKTKEIIKAVKEASGGVPVSVKTRTGFEKHELKEWIGFLLEQKLDALTVHLRTVRELSKADAHWELMPEILRMRDEISPSTVITGNGDLRDLASVHEKFEKYGNEGFMIGRGIFSNPWVFSGRLPEEIHARERYDTYLRHIRLFSGTFEDKKNYANLKKFAKAYINNFTEASICREKLMESKSLRELEEGVESLGLRYKI